MLASLSNRWTEGVIRHWKWLIAAWIVLAVVIRGTAPRWNDVAYDGDFAYLPADRTSVAGERLLDAAFPDERSRSQIVFVLSRDGDKLTEKDEILGLDLLRRLYHRLAEASYQRAISRGYADGPIDPEAEYAPWLELAKDALNQCVFIDEEFYKRISEVVPETAPTPTEPRMAIAYWDRANLLRQTHQPDEQIINDLDAAAVLCPDISSMVEPIADRDMTGWSSLIDVLSWQEPVVGRTLSSKSGRLAVGQLSTELASTSNIDTFEAAADLIAHAKQYSTRFVDSGLGLGLTGSGAIGGETLAAARDAIAYTEWFTVAMILIILTVVYRSPLLIAVPMISILIAVFVSTGLVTHLTQASMNGTTSWLNMRIFTTSRIFVVVILFGAGTDYCLFLISRLREEYVRHDWADASRMSLSKVSGALIGSALTTIVGLGMLSIADFGKFQHTGPVIAICLSVGLLVCLTFTPALLYGIGPRVFWPNRPHQSDARLSLIGSSDGSASRSFIWSWIAILLTRFPRLTLSLGLTLLLAPALFGYLNEQRVTYDLTGQLDQSGVTPAGMRSLRNHFSIGEINPVTLMMVSPRELTQEQLRANAVSLRSRLQNVDGVKTVRTADDPFGTQDSGVLSEDAIVRRMLRNHPAAKRHFFSNSPEYANTLVRVDVVMEGNPFEQKTSTRVQQLTESLQTEVQDTSSLWHDYSVYLSGTTPSIIDLRDVTLSDNRKIKVAVVLAVFAVLYLVIRRLGLCLYLIATVLLSYYATLGLTLVFFETIYGDEFLGLDWKLPLFLFVILVAVGQDYNVYLVTRILEEQRQLGWLSALRKAVARTGGIITACGLVMAATFFSMTASAWFPWLATSLGLDISDTTNLQGVVQLGFALGLGVLIDTFYVRTILVPSFFAVLGKSA